MAKSLSLAKPTSGCARQPSVAADCLTEPIFRDHQRDPRLRETCTKIRELCACGANLLPIGGASSECSGQHAHRNSDMTDAVENLQDEFSLRPIVVPVATALFIGIAFSFLQLPMFAGLWILLGLLCFMIGIPALLIWLIVMLVTLVKAAQRRMWKKAASRLLILLWVLPLMFFALSLGPYLHFGLSYPYYAMQVKWSPDGDTKPKTFDWGGQGFVGSAQTDRWLVYDPTDETKSRPRLEKNPEELNGWYEVEHLIGKFYLVEHHQI
jgi:hypothetical protein